MPEFLDTSDGIVRRFELYASNRWPTLLIGETGVGKTTLINRTARRLGRKVRTQLGATDQFVEDYVGRFQMNGLQTEWVPGELTLSVEQGSWYYLDEVGHCNGDVFNTFLPLCDGRRQLLSKRGTIDAHEDFFLVLSCNPEYFDRIPRELRDRLRVIRVDPISADAQIRMLMDAAEIDGEDAERLVRLAEVARRAGPDFVISTRQLLNAAQNLAANQDFETCVKDCLIDPVLGNDSYRRATLNEAFMAAGLRDFKFIVGDDRQSASDELDDEPFDDSEFYDDFDGFDADAVRLDADQAESETGR